MKKQEFLNTLRAALTGTISSNKIQSHIDYYNNYIDSEIRMGRLEEDVIESLGNPRLIAKTISNTEEHSQSSQYEYSDSESRKESSASKKGFNMNYNDEGGIDYKYGKLKLNSWYGKVIGVIIAILLCIVVFLVLGGLAFVFVRLLIPLIIIIMIVGLISRRR